jgi:hypothetical protein
VAVVTVDATARNSYYSAGNLGWSARSAFAYRTAVHQGDWSSNGTWGDTTANEAVAQSFTTVGAISVDAIRVALSKNGGAQTDNVSLKLYSSSANLPNTLIATATNVYAAANILLTNHSWMEFVFLTPVALSAATKYWIVIERSGAVDATNSYSASYNTGSVYAGGGRSTRNAGVWSAESSVNDLLFQVIAVVPSALYQLAQDTGVSPKLHMWKSTDGGASYSEVDAANAPTVTNGTYPFDACDTRSGPYIGVAYFTATNTVRARVFNMQSDTWGAELGAADATTGASNERSIRITLDSARLDNEQGNQTVWFTTSADDADLAGTRRGTGAWAAVTNTNFLSITSTEASLIADVVVDKHPGGYQHRFYYDCTNDDFSMRSALTTTYGAETDLSIAAADVETEHASACYQVYQNASAVDTIIAAFIDAGGTIQERILTLEATSASVTMAADNAVSAATTSAGRQLATCSFGGTRYIVASVSGTGIDYYTSTVAGTWSSATNWKTGLTASSISNVLSIEGYGLLVTYTDNGDTKVDWISAPSSGTPATMTVTAATAPAAGEAVTLDAASLFTVTPAAAPAAALAVILKGQGTLGVTVATAPAAGEEVTLDAAALFTVAPATAPAAGGTVALAGQGSLPVTEATAPAQGEAVTLDAAASLTVTPATAPAQGEAVNLAAAMAASLTVAPATAPAAGENVALKGQGALAVTVATAPAAGDSVTFDAAAKMTVTEATAPAAGGTVNLAASAAAALTVTPATAPAQGEAVTLDAAAKLTAGTATAPAQGEAVTLDVAANLIAGTATAPAAGGSVTLHGQGRLGVTEATAPAEAGNVQMFGGTAIPASLTVAPATAPAQAEAVTFDAAAVFAVTTATAPAQGQDVLLTATALMTIAAAVADATGLDVTLTGRGTLAISPPNAPAAADGAFTAAARFVIDAALADALADGDLTGAFPGDIDALLIAYKPLTATLQVVRILTGRSAIASIISADVGTSSPLTGTIDDALTVTGRLEADFHG